MLLVRSRRYLYSGVHHCIVITSLMIEEAYVMTSVLFSRNSAYKVMYDEKISHAILFGA